MTLSPCAPSFAGLRKDQPTVIAAGGTALHAPQRPPLLRRSPAVSRWSTTPIPQVIGGVGPNAARLDAPPGDPIRLDATSTRSRSSASNQHAGVLAGLHLLARQPITAHVTAIVRDRRFITVRNASGAGPAPSSNEIVVDGRGNVYGQSPAFS